MGIAKDEAELATKASRYLKAQMKRAGVTYAELAKRLEAQGLQETKLQPPATRTRNICRDIFSSARGRAGARRDKTGRYLTRATVATDSYFHSFRRCSLRLFCWRWVSNHCQRSQEKPLCR